MSDNKVKCSVSTKKGNMFQLGDSVSDWYTGGVGLEMYCEPNKEAITECFDEIREHLKLELKKTETFLRSVSLRTEQINNGIPDDTSTSYAELIK
jgi:hypothetical protein